MQSVNISSNQYLTFIDNNLESIRNMLGVAYEI